MPTQAAAYARDLRQSFGGPVHRPGSREYNEQRASLALPAPTPILVAEATGAADVRAALGWARRRDIPFAVQATDHDTVVAADDGLLLKTSRMASVLVDPDRRVARVDAGVHWGTVIAEAAPFGLAPLWVRHLDRRRRRRLHTRRRHRLAGLQVRLCRRQRAARRRGHGRRRPPHRHPDLFWAIRGGGGNFGVVKSLEFYLYPVRTVVAGTAIFPFERAADLLAGYREWQPSPELTTTVTLTRTSPTGPLLAVHGVYTGHPGSARSALAPLWRAAGGPMYDAGGRRDG
jgi:FAD/FMN-containing dehydrogenase